MAKSRFPNQNDSDSEESNSGSPDRNSDEPVNLSTLRDGVLHNPPNMQQDQDESDREDDN